MANQTDDGYMQLALDRCKLGIDAGQSPFGACIVLEGQVIACTHNHVWLDTDPTAHAEVCCIRQACKAVGAVHLAGASLYSTTEPCPMCFTAMHWARIGRIVYGADVADAKGFGFNELSIGNQQMKQVGASEIEIVPGVMRQEAIVLYAYWQSRQGRVY